MNVVWNVIGPIYRSLAEQIGQVNGKYAKPELHLSPMTKACLVALRIYLLAMIVLMGWFLLEKVRSLGHG